MSEFLDRISKLSPQRLALLADELNERLQTAEKRRRVPLAIVGIGCRLPGNVHNPEAFWTLLENGVDAIGEVPASRWDIEEFYDRNSDMPGKMATRWGGFIEDPDQFDPKFFGIAPAEATSMDPQQRLLLETAWESLEHAGIPPSSLAGTQTGVFIGICNSDYGQVALNSPREMITPYFAPGISHAVAAGRISYVLGLQGPNLAVDTSCSASLMAVHLACQSLRLDESDMALAGGVNLVFNQDITIALSQGKMLSPDGRCKAFSESANGFVRGEGCGIIVLKRLPDAIRDRNRILAVIRGSACNQDGRSSGLTAPNGPSQEAVIATALANADLRPDDIDIVEAHGTGTALGDPIEAGALNAVFAGHSRNADPLFVGSVKTNLGHLESAAGIAGLIKLVLSIQHGKIPPSLHLEKPNTRIEWDRLPIQIPTQLQTWNRRGEKRIGGVSSFGFSGTNVHVIVEEYPDSQRSDSVEDRPYLFTLSAKTGTALRTAVDRLHRRLTEQPSISLADVARTLNTGRSHFEYRVGITAASHAKLLESLNAFEGDVDRSSIHVGNVRTHSPRVAFVCADRIAGEKSYGQELYASVPVFRESMLRCEEILRKILEKPLTSVLYSEAANGLSGQAHNRIDDLPLAYRRAADFAFQYALTEVWRSCGIVPAAVYGCGAGEYVAACIAGVFRLEDGLHLAIADDGRISAELQKLVQSISDRAPQIPLILNGKENDGEESEENFAEYWPGSKSSVPTASAMSALKRENYTANVFIGDGDALQEFAKEIDVPGKWLACSADRRSDCRQFLSAAASLYVLGCELNMDRFYGETANIVSLPTYPFERERYWLSPQVSGGNMQEQPVRAAECDEWIYDLVWETKPLSQNMPYASAIDLNALIGQMSPIPATAELIRVERLTAALMPIYATYIVKALQEAGLTPLPREAFTLEEIGERLKIVPSRHRVLARMLGILVEDGVVECVKDHFRFVDFEPRPDADKELSRLSNAYPECMTEIAILRRCGNKLAAVIQGAYDPMQLVFADGSIEEAEQIYQDSPVCQFFNEKSANVVRAAVDRIIGRPARILEIGGGTGATTVSILPSLAGKDFEYTFTDVSASFLFKARNKFSDVSSMQYRVLDIENDPIGQGFGAEGYDIIIAANVLHATADLGRTLANVRKLLMPGGLLLLIEGVRPDRWLDLTFGLTDGWFRFVDLDLRPTHPLISAESWANVLRKAGMGSSRTISYIQSDGGSSQQHVIVAQADSDGATSTTLSQKPNRDWIILADGLGVGDALHQLLIAKGERSKLIRRPDLIRDADSIFHELKTGSTASASEIVYLWSMDVAEPIGSANALSQGVELCGKALIHLMQSQWMHGSSGGHLWIATRGAQATGSFDPTIAGAVQSLAWGIGRVFAVEAADRYRALIDLDPGLTNEAAAEYLLAELLAGDREDQIAYRDRQRLAPRLKRSSRNKMHASNVSLSAEGAYLLTGGLGGVGLKLAQWAAEHGAGHLVLLGRTGTGQNAGPFAEERIKTIRKIEDQGVNVTLVEGDVASDADMQVLFQRFGRELPPLRGVFHAATAISGAELNSITDEQLDTMLRAKVHGTWVLHECTKNLPLDFFLTFSSTTSLLGARNMAHYAAANQFLDSFAHYRHSLGLPMLSVNWGAWDVMRLASEEQQTNIGETGILPMQAEKIFRLFGEIISSSRAQITIANIDWNILKPLFELHRERPLLENFSNLHSQRRKVNAVIAPAQVSLASAIGMTPEIREEFIKTFVQKQAGLVLGFRSDELPPVDVALSDLGLDSLMAVDLKNRLQTGLGQELSPTVVFDYPTISEMVGMLETRLWAAHSSSEEDFASSQRDEIRI